MKSRKCVQWRKFVTVRNNYLRYTFQFNPFLLPPGLVNTNVTNVDKTKTRIDRITGNGNNGGDL
jgi:hypothetical protein